MPNDFKPYDDLLADLDQLSAHMNSLHAKQLNCRAGCSDCCHQHLGVFEVEAEAMRQALAALPTDTQKVLRQQAKDVLSGTRTACPLLREDRCSLYAARPVICRSHGYPLHYQGQEAGEILLDVCPLNFVEAGALESLELNQTLPLDRLNLRLNAINYVYCRDRLQDVQRAEQRLPLAALVLSQL